MTVDIRQAASSAVLILALCSAFGMLGCKAPEQTANEVDPSSTESVSPAPADRQTAFRVRSDFSAGLNADGGWAGDVNENVTVDADEPFRIRFEIEHSADTTDARRFRLQYRRNGEAWMNVGSSDFPYWESAASEGSTYLEEATPRISTVATTAYETGAETSDLLAGSESPYQGGAGVSLDAISPSWSGAEGQTEWEWPLVIRRYADGAVTNDEGDTFELRMADAVGCPLTSGANPVITVSVAPGHLGGTFVETPGRIGPWSSSNGDLYFLMEPAETHNVLMVVKSTDGGAAWQEVDGANRPAADDLEGFASVLWGDTIYMLHQTSDDVWLHSFRTSDHPTSPDTWDIRDEHVAAPPEPPTQVATLVARTDGSLVGVYGGPEKIHYKIRSVDGTWGEETVIDADTPEILSGPQAVLGADDVVHLAYTASDGTAWYRRIRPDGSLTPREQLASGIGTSEGDRGSVLPLVFIPDTNTMVAVYRLATERLWERRIIDHGAPTEPVQVSDRSVVQNAVDSDQTGADAVAAGNAVHVLFIEDGSGSIFHTQRSEGAWLPATEVVEGVNAQWVRGTLLTRAGEPAYGFVYDAGSDGGAGMNRYDEVRLGDR